MYFRAIGGVLYDKLYVTDGLRTEMYDPATNHWTTKRPGPQLPSDAAAAVLGAKLYVTGGWVSGAIRATSVYHPLTDTWTTAAPLPQIEP